MFATLAVDRVICDRYRIRGVIGKGGMGVIFKAEDTALRRMVALKLVSEQRAADGAPNHEERFLREASLNAQIAHPNVITIYDYGRGSDGGEAFCYIAMELLAGETLGERLRRTRAGLPMAEVLHVITQVARGLRAAHQRGLVHRDLKPDNIMLTPGEDGGDHVRLIDFGLAKDTAEQERRLTDIGTVMGTPEYMAPEQVEGRDVDARTDLYALGIVLYECITGSPPFRGENAFRVAASHVREPAPLIQTPSGSPRASAALQDLVRKLLEKNPDARIQTTDEVLRRLGDLPESKSLRTRDAIETTTLTTTAKYQTGRKISDSPRAVLYEATHLELGRQVVIKLYRASHAGEIARLKRELPSLALLRHGSNARVLDMGATQGPRGAPFLVMERVRGATLRALIAKHGKLAWPRAVEIVTAILDGLGEAHAVGVLHRNLTPDHVLVPGADTRREGIKIVGYRIPDVVGDGSGPLLLGLQDAAYLPPEVLHGAPMSERADLFAAAVILHECLLGRLPGSGLQSLREAEPRSEQIGIPAAIADVLRRSVSVDPAERFDSAAEFATALLAARASEGGDALPRDSDVDSRVSSTQRRLRSTGKPVVWILTGDPALRKPPLSDVVLKLRSAMRVEEVPADHRGSLAARIRDEDELPPWVVVFGGMHVILEDPLLAALSRTPEVSRLLVSTHANTELLETAVNFCGLDQHITLPAEEAVVVGIIERLVARTGAARRYYDDLRLFAQRASLRPSTLRSQTSTGGA